MKIICDWENCNEIGAYKAPVEKDNSRKYRLLCLNHIKIFNKNWNYFENMNDQEIEFFIKSDLTWHKSTKTFGSSDNFFNILWNNALDDKLNIFKSSNFKDFKKAKASPQDKDALEVMDLNQDVKWEQIQSKFKELVKMYHPDKNQGNKKFEEKLKKITLAYSQLKKTLGKKRVQNSSCKKQILNYQLNKLLALKVIFKLELFQKKMSMSQR